MSSSCTDVGHPILNIDLSHHKDKFRDDSLGFSLEKKVNFIFGKNGTGKTTIADEIFNQLSTDYEVCIFKDFYGVVENERLNAIALGTENTTIQREIDAIDNEIKEIKKQVNEPEHSGINNLFTKSADSKKVYDEQVDEIDKFFAKSARKIKNLSDPQISITTYNKNDFKADIPKADYLTDDNIIAHKGTIKTDKKESIETILFPDINLLAFLKSTNEILCHSVIQPKELPELLGNVDKQNFARVGMDIHEHKAGEVCAFCGNKIDESRWQQLGDYFNDEVKKLEKRITTGIDKIGLILDDIEKTKKLEEATIYNKFEKKVNNLNLLVEAKKNEYKDFFKILKTALEEKKKDLFSMSTPLEETIVPEDFKNIGIKCENLVKANNELTLCFENEQQSARDALRYHEVKKMLDEFNYEKKNKELLRVETISEKDKADLEERIELLQKKQDDRRKLVLQTKDEEKIALKINELLKRTGVVSFSLELIEDDGEEKQKGQYQIKGHDGNIRPITALSKGEKNIIAFLYFIFSLENIDSDNKPKIIILDDPMTSNDDTMQYLMICEIQKLYRNPEEENYLILFTHNCHFYLNVRPDTRKTYRLNGKELSFYEKYGVYHLFSDGKRSRMKAISKGKQDFITSYEILWKELVFLYHTDDASADLLFGPCRKICETYMNFTKKSIDSFYGTNLDAKKLFDVNLHAIGDFEAETNGRTKEEIRNILCNLFKDNDAEEHFNSYWRSGEAWMASGFILPHFHHSVV